MDEARYTVTGMTCDGCVRGLTRALERRLPGLEVVVTLRPGEVVVRGGHTPEAVREAVVGAGFGLG